MKKTLVALAVMVAAGSANAAVELYNKDGVSVNLKGDMEVRYKKAIRSADDTTKKFVDSDMKMEIDDADFAFDLRYALDDSLSVGGFFEIQDSGSNAGDAYVGFYTADMGTLTLGRQATILDDYGIGNDYLFGIKSKVDAFDFAGEEVVKYQIDKGQFFGGIAIMQNKALKNSKILKDGTHIDGNLGARFGDAQVEVFYGQTKEVGTKDGKLTVAALEGSYTIDALKLEAIFGQNKFSDGSTDTKTDIMGVAAQYTMGVWTFSGGLSNSKEDTSGAKSVNDMFVNAAYAFTSNVTAYAEIGNSTEEDVAGDKAGTGYGMGMKVSF